MESTALEVGIGLAVIFFLVATVVNAANESLTRLLNVRSKALWATLETLLTKPKGNADTRKPVNLGFVTTVFNLEKDEPRPTVPITHETPASVTVPADETTGTPLERAIVTANENGTEDLMSTPSIWSLDYAKNDGPTKVWNIPTAVFTGALLELAVIKGSGDSVESKVKTLAERYEGTPLGQYLGSLSTNVAGDVDKFTDHVGAWFDGQMQRLTDSYRRLTKYLLAAIGLVVALAFNVDAIAIGSGLATNADQRAAVLLLADNLDPTGLPCDEKEPTEEGGAGAGGSGSATDTDAGTDSGTSGESSGNNDEAASASDLKCATENLASIQNLDLRHPLKDWTDSWKGDDFVGWFAHLLGLLLTAFAVGLGGPFWFDTVGALAGLRNRKT